MDKDRLRLEHTVVTKGLNNRQSVEEALDNSLYKGKGRVILPSANQWKHKMWGSAHQRAVSFLSDFACCCLTS